MSTNGEIIGKFIEEVLNRGDIEATGRYFSEHVVEQVPMPGQGPGLAGLKSALREFQSAFPDMHWKIEEQISEGDKVVTRFEWTGTHGGPLWGIPATSRLVKVWGIVIDRLESGKIKDTRIIMDTLGMMTQLGVVPGPK